MDTYEGVGPVELRLRRSVGSFGVVKVTWQALPREADSDDFTPMAGKVTFADGQMEAVIVINVVDDDTPEDLQVSDDRLIALFNNNNNNNNNTNNDNNNILYLDTLSRY